MLNFLLTVIYKLKKIKRGEYPLSILYYHHVLKISSPYHPDEITVDAFDKQIKFLSTYFNILMLDDAINLLKKKKLPPRALVITFDDGYLDNVEVAAPLLKKYHCPATFFISTQGVEDGYLWNDAIEQGIAQTTVNQISSSIMNEELALTSQPEKLLAYNKLINFLKFLSNNERTSKIESLLSELQISQTSMSRTMMNERELKELHQQGFEIAAHTHSHTILTTETNVDAKNELIENKTKLEKIVGENIRYLAYPNGLFERDFNDQHCQIAQKIGFKAAFSTNDGGATSSINDFKIPRFMPYRKQLSLFALSIAKIAGEHV